MSIPYRCINTHHNIKNMLVYMHIYGFRAVFLDRINARVYLQNHDTTSETESIADLLFNYVKVKYYQRNNNNLLNMRGRLGANDRVVIHV